MSQPTSTVKNITGYRVIYGDTDQMGVVYYANYLRWFEKGRAEFLRQIGFPYGVIEQQGFHFPVTKVTCRYASAAHYDEVVQIETRLVDLGRVSLSFVYRISREGSNDLLATGSTKHACIDHSGKITRIPPTLRDDVNAIAR